MKNDVIRVRIIAVLTKGQTERLAEKVTASPSLPVRTKRNVWKKIGPQMDLGLPGCTGLQNEELLDITVWE